MKPFENPRTKTVLSIALLALSLAFSEYILRTTMSIGLAFPGFSYLAWNYVPLFLVFAMFLLLTNRMIASALVTGGISLALVALNAKKFAVLSKPLIPSDFMLLKQVFGDIELYLKYVNVASTMAYSAGFLVLLGLVMAKEGPFLRPSPRLKGARAIGAAALALVALNTTHASSYTQNIYDKSPLQYYEFKPLLTVRASGFFFNFVKMAEGMAVRIPHDYGDVGIIGSRVAALPATPLPRVLPDIVVVQNESFYDLRKHELQVDGRCYQDFDEAESGAVLKGTLQVPTVAGNTIKTEFSFLTGIDMAALPADCDYPYRYLVRRDLWSIAQHLKSIGYRTILIHPYSRTFWDRNIAIPLLGFDEFIDGRYFPNSQNEGPYVADMALFDRIASITGAAGHQPVFIFAITMENHGPWDVPRVEHQHSFSVSGNITAEEQVRVRRYLHHVADASKMARALTEHFRKETRPTVVSFYGDHVPGFVDLLERVKTRNPEDSIHDTPFFVWKNYGGGKPASRGMAASFLASTILDVAGLDSDPYFRANSYYRDISGGEFESGSVDDALRRSYAQLLYDNLLTGLGKTPVHARQGGGKVQATESDARITDYGPKETVQGVGFNVQPDGSSAIWMTVRNVGRNYVIVADGEPLRTSFAPDGLSMTATLPKFKYEHPGQIRLSLYDPAANRRSNEVCLTVKTH